MKRRKLLHGSKLIFLFLLFFSCKKDSYDGYDNQKVAIEFFSNTSKNPIVSKFISDMRITNSKKEFANDIVEKFGKPYWQFSNAFKCKGGITIITPIIDENDKEITALLIGVYNNNRLYTHLVEEKIIKNVEQINNSGPDKNDYGYYFYHFNKSIFNRGPKVNDLVFKNGKLITYGALMLKERTLMGWVGNQWVNEKDWYQYDPYEQRWNYIDTTYEYGIDWEYVPDDPYTPPSEPYYPPSDPSGGGGGEPGNGEAARDIINNVTDPCLKVLVDNLTNNNVAGKIAEIISKLDGDKKVKISVVDAEETITFKPANIANQNYDPGTGTYSATIILSKNALVPTTKENSTTIIIHELIHAYFSYVGKSTVGLQAVEHENMATNYVQPMAKYLSDIYGISTKDATALAWSGLSDAKSYIDYESFEYPGGTMTKNESKSIYADYVIKSSGIPTCN